MQTERRRVAMRRMFILGGLVVGAGLVAIAMTDAVVDSYPTRDEALRHYVFREHLADVLPADASRLEVAQSADSGSANCRFKFESTEWLERLRPAVEPIDTFNMLWRSRWPGEPRGVLSPGALPAVVKLFCVKGVHLAVNLESRIAACWFVPPSRCTVQSD